MRDGFVLRYRTERNVDGLPGSEGVFLPCSFWLADCLHLMGRTTEARELFERLLKLRNDLGLLSEEYDPRAKRQLGNFPQAFTHVALVNTANLLSGRGGPSISPAPGAKLLGFFFLKGEEGAHSPLVVSCSCRLDHSRLRGHFRGHKHERRRARLVVSFVFSTVAFPSIRLDLKVW